MRHHPTHAKSFDEIIVVTRIWIGHNVYLKSMEKRFKRIVVNNILLSCDLGQWKRFENEIFRQIDADV